MLIGLLATGAAARAEPGVAPAVERIDAILGHPLVVPVRAEDPRDLLRPGSARIALDDASSPRVSFYRLEPAGLDDAGWLGRVTRYRALPASEALRRPVQPPGVWYALIELPLEAVTQGIWFGSERYEVNWLPDPERAALESDGRPLWSSPVPPEARVADAVVRALEASARDPFQAWRVRLVRDGIAPTGGEDRAGAGGTDLGALREEVGAGAGERFLGELSRHHEARWQLILGRLALIDPEAAERLRRRLGGVAVIDAEWMPLWTPDSPELRALQADLLSPWVDDRTRVLRALGWLDAQPGALAWVIDDAGSPGLEDARLNPTIGVLSLPAREGPQLIEVGGASGSPVLETIPSRRAAVFDAGVPLVEGRGSGTATRTAALPVRVGRSDTAVQAVASVVGARPPGVRVGPLLRGWTMPALLEGSPASDALPDPDALATGLVRNTARPGRAGPGEGWSVYLELGGSPGPEDAVTIHTGPMAVPRGVWRIERDGTVHRLFGGSDLVELRVAETEDGWAIDARLPPGAIDEDGVLRLGLTRERAGERTSWPRRMTPGQDEPGRLPIDTTRWSGL